MPLELDSIFVTSEDEIVVHTRDFEKKIHPISKLNEVDVIVKKEENSNLDLQNIYITFSIHNYVPYKELNDTYNDLNPQYNPEIIWGTDSDNEY